MSGGGPSGAVDYPDYMEDIQVNWLTGGTTGSPAPALDVPIEDAMDAAFTTNSGNPWVGETSYSPTTELDLLDTKYSEVDTLVARLDHVMDWRTMFRNAKQELEDAFYSDEELDADVAEFERNATKRHRRGLASYTGGMADINAVNSSQFIIGMALQQSDLEDSVNKYEAEKKLIQKKEKAITIISGISQMLGLLSANTAAEMNMLSVKQAITQLSIIAEKESDEDQRDLDFKEALWDLEVFQYGANVLASISGSGHPRTNAPSKAQTALGGAVGGAALGAQLSGGNPFITAGFGLAGLAFSLF